VHTGAPSPSLEQAKARVLGIQTKLHRWATADAGRRFDDLFHLVTDPAFLAVAGERVRTNRGARTAGVDGATAHYIRSVRGEEAFLADVRTRLKTGQFVPLPVAERMIPQSGGGLRRLGIPTVTDRVVQAALKLVLEPIWEADFQPCSYGFRPRRRAQDAIAEIVQNHTWGYHWVLDADVEACFDSIDHAALLGRLRRRIGDKRVLALVKAFGMAEVLTADGAELGTVTGTPQGGILSPLLANIARSTLDDHFAEKWQATGTSMRRRGIRKRGGAIHRLVRYADDFVVMVHGARAHAEAIRAEVATVLAPWAAPLGGQDAGGAPGRGLRLPRLAHPAPPSARHQPAVPLHLSVEEGAAFGDGPGAHADPQSTTPDAVGPAAPAQPGAAGLGHLLPARGLEGDIQLPGPLRGAAGHRLAAQATPRPLVGTAAPAFPVRMDADAGRDQPVRPRDGDGQPLPLSRNQDPASLDSVPCRVQWRL
jgi:group II intron reverse transcriptase/maturase